MPSARRTPAGIIARPRKSTAIIFAGQAGSARNWWLCLAAEFLLLTVPLLVAPLPPLCDMPNHLARLYLLAYGAEDPVLSKIYLAEWHLLPNLAIDLIGPALMRVLPVMAVGRLLVGFTIAVLLAGTIVLHRAIFRRRSYWPLASGLIAYNGLVLLGFLNFGISLGLAMLSAAAVLSARRSWQRILLAALATPLIFLCHILGLIAFMAILAAKAYAAPASAVAARGVQRWVTRLLPLAATVAVAILLLALTPHPHYEQAVDWLGVRGKAVALLVPFINYRQPLDLASALLVLGAVCLLAWRRALDLPTLTVVALALLTLGFAVAPFQIAGGSYLDSRITLTAAFVVVACVDLRPGHPMVARALGLGVALLMLVRLGVLADAWAGVQQDLPDFEALGGVLPAGARVLVTTVTVDEDRARYFRDQPRWRELRGLSPAFYHWAALWVVERHIFDPLTFDNPGQQPLAVAPAYQALITPGGLPLDYRDLIPGHSPESPAIAAYLEGWNQKFDYVVVLSAGRAGQLDQLAQAPLTQIGKTDIAALYAVRR